MEHLSIYRYILLSFFENIISKSERYRTERSVQKKTDRTDVLVVIVCHFPTRNSVLIIINLSYRHVPKTVKSRTARKKYEGGTSPLASLSTKLRWKL